LLFTCTLTLAGWVGLERAAGFPNRVRLRTLAALAGLLWIINGIVVDTRRGVQGIVVSPAELRFGRFPHWFAWCGLAALAGLALGLLGSARAAWALSALLLGALFLSEELDPGALALAAFYLWLGVQLTTKRDS